MTDVIFTDQDFQKEVLQSEQPVVVDFWAPWCGPCKIVDPIIGELAIEYAGKVRVGKINVDENPTRSSEYGIMSIPSVVFFKNGKPIKTMIGAQSKENFKQGIEEILAS